MKKVVLTVTLLLACTCGVLAQRPKAKPGDCWWWNAKEWRGYLESTNDTTREITLVYEKKKKLERFTGILPEAMRKWGARTEQELWPSGLPLGSCITVCYKKEKAKVAGRKVAFNKIVRLGPCLEAEPKEFTGEVESTNDRTGEITFVSREKHKIERFTGILQRGFKVYLADGVTEHELKPSELRLGTKLTVCYQKKTVRVEGRVVEFNEIFRLASCSY